MPSTQSGCFFHSIQTKEIRILDACPIFATTPKPEICIHTHFVRLMRTGSNYDLFIQMNRTTHILNSNCFIEEGKTDGTRASVFLRRKLLCLCPETADLLHSSCTTRLPLVFVLCTKNNKGD